MSEQLPWQAGAGDSGGVVIALKVVPGASRSKLAGVLGDRLKVTVAAPPEGGKANREVCELLAEVLGLPARQVSVTAGHGQARKTVRVSGMTLQAVQARLEAAMRSR